MRRWSAPVRGLVEDGSVVLVLAGLSWLVGRHLFASGLNEVAGRHLGVVAWWIETAAASAGFVVTRRRLPEAALALAAGGALLHTLQGWPPLPADLLGAISLCAVALRRQALVATAALFGAIVVAYAATGATVAGYRSRLPSPLDEHGGFPAVAGLLVITWFAGAAVARQRVRLTRLVREGDEREEEAAARERALITREIHDVVAHGLSVMVVQAQGAAAALRSRPDRAEEALDAIVATGRSSLAEMRRLLGSDASQRGEEPELAPPPGVSRLAELIDTVSAAGLRTTLVIEGPQIALPSGIDLSVYRVVQEALTNAIRHAGEGATSFVRVGLSLDRVEVEVTDSGVGTAASANGGGHGLAGIRERISSLGGELQLGPGPGGGFRVCARIPIPHPS